MNVLNVVVFVGLEFTFLPRRTPHNNVGDVEIQKKPDDGDNKLSMSLPHSQTAESTLSEL